MVSAAAGDVLWSLRFLGRHALLILALSAIPAAQRVTAAFHPDDPRVYAWPIEMVVAVVRAGTLVLVFWIGWRDDASARRHDIGTVEEWLGALGAYARHDWVRPLAAVLIAAVMFAVLNALVGPVVEAIAGGPGDDFRIIDAWTFGVRNMLIIPLFYAIAYGLVRPAFLRA